MFFLVAILCLLLYFGQIDKYSEQSKRSYIIIVSIILILLSGLRSELVGNDTINYLNSFENSRNISWSQALDDFFYRYISQNSNQEKDPGFLIFQKLISLVTSDARIYLFIVAALFYAALGYFAQKTCANLNEVLFFYIFYIALFNSYVPNSAVRQTIAISFLLVGYVFLNENKWKAFLLCLLLASFMHKSALLGCILIPLVYNKWIKGIFYSGIVLYPIILSRVNSIAYLFISQNDVYNAYITDSYYVNGGKPYLLLILVLGLYLLVLLHLKNDSEPKDNVLFYSGTLLSLLFCPLIWVNPTLIRIMTYFGPLMGIMVARSLGTIKNGKLIYCSVLGVFLIYILRDFGSYHFLWDTF